MEHEASLSGTPLPDLGIGPFPSLANVLDLLLDAVCLVDASGRFVFVSAAAEHVFGYRPDEMVGMSMLDLIHPDDLARTLQAAADVLKGRRLTQFENRYIRKDGDTVHIMWSARWSEAHRLRIAVARDVTDRKRSESRQAALYAVSEAAYAAEDLPTLFRKIHAIVARLLPAHDFFVALTDESTGALAVPFQAEPHAVPPLLDADALCAKVVRTGRALQLDEQAVGAWLNAVPSDYGHATTAWLGVPLIGQAGTLGALVVRTAEAGDRYADQDVELLQYVATQAAAAVERKRIERHLQHAALHDALTGLPNRALLEDRLENALAVARRDGGRVALLFVDLDLFKSVNDTFGHAAGDRLLQDVALRLKACVRESDTVARLGGDEFIVLVTGTGYPKETLGIAETVRDCLARPFALDEGPVTVSPSVGVASFPEHGRTGPELMRCADGAMYAAKNAGGNRVALATGCPSPEHEPRSGRD